VSTVGLISQMRKLTKDLPEVSLALSLHAPNQEMRTAIVPTATRYPIEKLIAALDHHMMAYLKKRVGEGYTKEERIKESTRRRAMIEYVMRKYLLIGVGALKSMCSIVVLLGRIRPYVLQFRETRRPWKLPTSWESCARIVA
jgi:adenine C2-methylase RlmN of 23S rRNA A2503 and tRNA A37